ncbi:hypothetical protein [Mesorhizobium sp. IMUNJ 23232]|uniref:hypothetical protein n=1 Tax=Mesorhizobium sp. IMUNJ 23232 TaxID=3376064 RepID=UPI0037BD62D9
MALGGKRDGAGRPPGRAITEDDRQNILRRYVAGEPVTKIAKRFGVATSYPTILAKRRGITRRQTDDFSTVLDAEPEVFSPSEASKEAEIKKLAGRGISAATIATMLRIPYREVAKMLGVY